MDIVILASSGTLSPLPAQMKGGVIVMGLFGCFSLLSCAILFLYITYRLLKPRWSADDEGQSFDLGRDYISELTIGANRRPTHASMRKLPSRDSEARASEVARRPESNSFLTLIHNLLMADIVQALAFTLSLSWWQHDGIFVPSATCTAQSFFITLGSVSISAFLVGISLNTLFTVVWGFKLSRLAVRCLVVFNWLFSFTLAVAGLGVSRSMPDDNEDLYYARSISLCWINGKYISQYGFWFQNFWLSLSIGVTIVCYACIFTTLLLNKQSSRQLPRQRKKNAPPEPSGHHPAFLVYPTIFIICSAPITLVGLLAQAGARVDLTYFTLVSIIASLAGLLDAILWSTTILFSSSKDLEEIGLAKYNFMRTPERAYGNIVWVEGATRIRTEHKSDTGTSHNEGKWKKLKGSDTQSTPALPSQDGQSSEDHGIHMDTITMVTSESVDP